MIFKSWAPGFPGFYETIWSPEPYIDGELYEINSARENNGLEPITNQDLLHYDYKEYERNVANEYCKVLNKVFKDNSINFLKDIKFICVSSPREYNFYNDSIKIEIDVNIPELSKFVIERKEKFSEYLKKRYTSYPGFIPYYSKKYDDWKDDTKNFCQFEEENDHYLDSILEFIYCQLEIDKYEIFEMCSDYMYISCVNYDELTTAVDIENLPIY